MIIAGCAAFFFAQTFTYEGTITGLFPRILSAVVLILVLCVVVTKFRTPKETAKSAGEEEKAEVDDDGGGTWSTATPAGAKPVVRWQGSLVWMVAYFVSIYLVGFWVATFLYALFVSRQIQNKSLKMTIAFALLTTVTLFVVFSTVFYVPLPEGLLFEIVRGR